MSIANLSASTRARILTVNGAALGVTGVVQVVQELLSHYASRGVWDDIFRDSPYTIGVVEAHAFAAMTGFLLVAIARREPAAGWHGYAALVHLMLGTANRGFWQTFRDFDKVSIGVVATAVHGIFFVLELACFASASRAPATTGDVRHPLYSQDRVTDHS